jgi:ClpX C4-type zinc finger
VDAGLCDGRLGNEIFHAPVSGVDSSAMKGGEPSADNCCSWCGKPEQQVKTLIAGAGGFICDGCVAMCNDVLAAEGGKRRGWLRRKAQWTGYKPLA